HTVSWLAMLFSAGMGIGLVFYGSSEPISHYLAPLLVVIGAIFPAKFGEITGHYFFLGNKNVWLVLYVTVYSNLGFCVFLVFSPIGKLKLGKPTDKPEFHTVSWLAMLFSAGMGIGLVFYGSSEPISHYLAP
ncbi:BCCT family transporter, partial [Staphylococcus aureus]|uniref:BCCT family transporter n=1 Tax=Staphylococcus aureus TaxID=1280 RepID=UPI001611BE59